MNPTGGAKKAEEIGYIEPNIGGRTNSMVTSLDVPRTCLFCIIGARSYLLLPLYFYNFSGLLEYFLFLNKLIKL